MRLNEIIINAVLVLLVAVLAVICVRSVYFAQDTARHPQSTTSHPLTP